MEERIGNRRGLEIFKGDFCPSMNEKENRINY